MKRCTANAVVYNKHASFVLIMHVCCLGRAWIAGTSQYKLESANSLQQPADA